MTRLVNQRALFDIPDDVSYLNCAYMSPLMKRVVAAGSAAIESKAHPWSISSNDFFALPDRARGLAGRIIGSDARNIAVVPSVSYGLATAAKNVSLDRGQHIIALEDQFPANIYVWQRLAADRGAQFRILPKPQDGDWTRAILESIDAQTGIVAVPHCHWTDGSLIDLLAVGQRVRDVGASLVLDLAQSAGALPISMAEIQPDFAVFPTYKWALGPYSLGFLYASDRWCEEGRPLEETWTGRKGSEDFTALVSYEDDYQPGAIRFDMGQRANFQLMSMATAALAQINEWGVENIHETLSRITSGIAQRADSIGLRAAPASLRAGHYLGLRFPGDVPEGLVERLAARKIFVSVRGTSMRVTPHLYNTETDIDRLFDALG